MNNPPSSSSSLLSSSSSLCTHSCTEERFVMGTKSSKNQQSLLDDQFVSKVEDYICSVCLGVPHPQTALEHIPCGHLFCQNCAELLQIQNIISCPSCTQQNFDSSELRLVMKENKSLYRQMMKLDIKCENHIHGCQEVVTLENLQNHIDKHCSYSRIYCPECGNELLRYQLSQHKNECVSMLYKEGLPLITISEGEFVLQSRAMNLISHIPNPIKTVVIGGNYQIGKSTFLNTLIDVDRDLHLKNSSNTILSPQYEYDTEMDNSCKDNSDQSYHQSIPTESNVQFPSTLSEKENTNHTNTIDNTFDTINATTITTTTIMSNTPAISTTAAATATAAATTTTNGISINEEKDINLRKKSKKLKQIFKIGEGGDESVTKGLWVHAIDVFSDDAGNKNNEKMITNDVYTILYVDTEGLDDPEQSENVSELLQCLAILLSSHYIYRLRKNCGKDELKRLEFLKDLVKEFASIQKTEQNNAERAFTFLFSDHGSDCMPKSFESRTKSIREGICTMFKVNIDATPMPLNYNGEIDCDPQVQPFKSYYNRVRKISKTKSNFFFSDGKSLVSFLQLCCDNLSKVKKGDLLISKLGVNVACFRLVEESVNIFKKYLERYIFIEDEKISFEKLEAKGKAKAMKYFEQKFGMESQLQIDDSDYIHYKDMLLSKMKDLTELFQIIHSNIESGKNKKNAWLVGAGVAGGVLGGVAGIAIGGLMGGTVGARVCSSLVLGLAGMYSVQKTMKK